MELRYSGERRSCEGGKTGIGTVAVLGSRSACLEELKVGEGVLGRVPGNNEPRREGERRGGRHVGSRMGIGDVDGDDEGDGG